MTYLYHINGQNSLKLFNIFWSNMHWYAKSLLSLNESNESNNESNNESESSHDQGTEYLLKYLNYNEWKTVGGLNFYGVHTHRLYKGTHDYIIAETIMKSKYFKGLSYVNNASNILNRCVSAYDRYGYCKLIWNNIEKNIKLLHECLNPSYTYDKVTDSPLVRLVCNHTCTEKWLKLFLFQFGKKDEKYFINKESLKAAYDICIKSENQTKVEWAKLICQYASEINQPL